MKKTVKRINLLLYAIVCMLFFLTVAFTLWMINSSWSSNSNELPPLISVEGIAVGDDKVFALDNRYDRVYVYSEQGSFLFFIDLPKWGIKYFHYQASNIVVYCSAKNRDVLFFYDEDTGTLVLEQVLNSRDEVVWDESIYPKKTVEYEGETITFIDRNLLPSIVTVSGTETTSFSVEPFWTHVLWNMVALIFFGCFLCAFFSIGRFFLYKKNK